MKPCSETDKHGATIRPDSYSCMDMWEIADFRIREGAHNKYGRHGLTCPDCKYGEWTGGLSGENSVCDEFFPGWARSKDDIEQWVNAPDKAYWWLPLGTQEEVDAQVERLREWLARIGDAKAEWGEDGSFKHQSDAVKKVIRKTLEVCVKPCAGKVRKWSNCKGCKYDIIPTLILESRVAPEPPICAERFKRSGVYRWYCAGGNRGGSCRNMAKKWYWILRWPFEVIRAFIARMRRHIWPARTHPTPQQEVHMSGKKEYLECRKIARWGIKEFLTGVPKDCIDKWEHHFVGRWRAGKDA